MKTIPFVDLKAGYQPLKEEILHAIHEVLENMHLYLGENVHALEREYAEYIGAKFAIGVGSGTDALFISLIAAGIRPGDEVITSPHTFFATAEAIVHTGARPVFADITPEDFAIAPERIKQAITPKTRAIIPVHMYGQSAPMKEILALAKQHGLIVVEDACQAHGATLSGKKCGSLGDAGCFSFYYTKNLGAYGEGGIITTDDPEIAEKARIIRNHGHTAKYDHATFGYNSRLDEMQAAILRIRLKHLDAYNTARRSRAALYTSLLKDSGVLTPSELPERSHMYHLYVIRCQQRDALQSYLQEKGIGTGIHYRNSVHLQSACSSLGYVSGSMPIAENICNEILSLPMYPELQDQDIEYVANAVRSFYAQ